MFLTGSQSNINHGCITEICQDVGSMLGQRRSTLTQNWADLFQQVNIWRQWIMSNIKLV